LKSLCYDARSEKHQTTHNLTSPVRKAYGLRGADFHKTLYTGFHPNRTIHFESTERNAITPLTEDAVYCADCQHTHKHSIHLVPNPTLAQETSQARRL